MTITKRSLIRAPVQGASPSVAAADSESGSAAAPPATVARRNPRTEMHLSSGGVGFAAGNSKTLNVDCSLAEYQTFSAKVKIDQNGLDMAIMQQPHVYLQICERYSLAVSLRDQAKDVLARKDSELARGVRAQFLADKVKPTEGQINDEVILNPVRKPLLAAYLDAKVLSDNWGNLSEAFQQRMRMLQKLVDLHATGYFNSRAMGSGNNSTSAVQDSAIREAAHRQRTGG